MIGHQNLHELTSYEIRLQQRSGADLHHLSEAMAAKRAVRRASRRAPIVAALARLARLRSKTAAVARPVEQAPATTSA